MKPIEIVVVGAGCRGAGYAMHAATFPDKVRITAVAEPRDYHRNQFAATYGLPADRVFASWEELAALPRVADAVIIATQDEMHLEPALRFAELGYHIMLEKPMAPDPIECRQIYDAAIQNNIIFAVCHVMRYTPYTQKLKELLDAGVVGQVINMQHLEPVGYWHQAHSFVRGNWRREDESSPMLLSKSCHDLDWIRYLVGRPCTRITSFGSLVHFRADQKPEGAGERCLTCDIEPKCPYSAKKIYLGKYHEGVRDWPLSVLTPEVTLENLVEALEAGPYGRCVYGCDNDVVDNQVVNMEFEGGLTASFTMVAFTDHSHRKTRVFGTHGMLEGDGEFIKVNDFLTDETTTYDTGTTEASLVGGHGGGDYFLVKSFVEAVYAGDPSLVLSGPVETLESHLMVFAAEEARRTNTVVQMEEYSSRIIPKPAVCGSSR